jgi:hypothetical protein
MGMTVPSGVLLPPASSLFATSNRMRPQLATASTPNINHARNVESLSITIGRAGQLRVRYGENVGQIDRRTLLCGGAAFITAACSHKRSAKPKSTEAESRPRGDAASAPERSFHDVSSDLSRDGRYLAIAAGPPCHEGEDGPVAIWDVAAQRIAKQRMVPGGIGLSLDNEGLLQVSPSSQLLISNTGTNEITVLDATSRELATLGQIVLDDTRDSAPRGVLLPGERELFSRGERGFAITPIRGFHDARSPEVRWLGVREFPDGRLAVRADSSVVGTDEQISALDLARRKIRYAVPAPWAHYAPVAFSPDAAILAGASQSKVAFVDTASGRTLATASDMDDQPDAVLWDTHGRRTAFQRRGSISIFDGFAPLCRFDRVRGRPFSVAPDLGSFAFSPDGARGIVAFSDGDIAAFELAASPRVLFRTHLVADAHEWCGVYWPAADRILAVTALEIIFVDAGTGAIAARQPLGFAADRQTGCPQRP